MHLRTYIISLSISECVFSLYTHVEKKSTLRSSNAAAFHTSIILLFEDLFYGELKHFAKTSFYSRYWFPFLFSNYEVFLLILRTVIMLLWLNVAVAQEVERLCSNQQVSGSVSCSLHVKASLGKILNHKIAPDVSSIGECECECECECEALWVVGQTRKSA